MSQPPFPVPIGMEWDPEKKRFFKSNPKGGKINTKQNETANRSRKKQRNEPERNGRVPLKELQKHTPISFNHFRHSDDQLYILRSKMPRWSNRASMCRSLAVERLGRAKHVRTASTDLTEGLSQFANRRLVGIQGLRVSEDFPSLLYLMSWNGFVYLIDTSQMNAVGSTQTKLHLAELSWTSIFLNFQLHLPLSPTTLSFRSTMVDRMLIYAPNETPNCYGLEKDCFAFFTSSQELRVYKLETPSGFDSGRSVQVSPQKYHIKIPKNWPSGGYVTLSMKRLQDENCLLICVGIGNKVCLYRLCLSNEKERLSNATIQSEEQKQMKIFRRVESDVISHDFSLSGRFVIVGLRNGKIAKISLDFDSACKDQHRPYNEGSSTMKVPAREYLPFSGAVGAVTNLRYLSEYELLVAYSSGKLISISLDKPEMPLRVFEGHVNSWTLNPPLAVDVDFGVFALAGQDRRVRMWSIDQSVPLGEHGNGHKAAKEEDMMQIDHGSMSNHSKDEKGILLSKTVFSNEITGLCFCQRRAIGKDESRQNIAFLSKNLPALAVSCGGGETLFFE